MEFLSKQSEQFVEDTFQGSLPRFLAAFTAGKRLSDKDVAELKKSLRKTAGKWIWKGVFHDIFRIVRMSLTGGIVIVLVLLIRLFLARVPKIYRYLLWGVVLARLLCPFSFFVRMV